jgi:hypothetical protein
MNRRREDQNTMTWYAWGMSRSSTAAIAILGAVLVMATVGALMSFPTPRSRDQKAASRRLVLASPVGGQLLDDREPVANATVTRTMDVAMLGQTATQTTTTNEDGKFSFPIAVSERFFRNLFRRVVPHEPNISVNYRVEINNETRLFLSLTKSTYDEGAEIRRLNREGTFEFVCNIAVPIEQADRDQTIYWSNCRLCE